jgi:PAS domain S-box-containing protein
VEDSAITNEGLMRRLATAEARALTAEAAQREGDIRHRMLIESWAQAVWETDGAGVVVTDSPSWRAYTGQTLEEWLGYGWLDAIHSDDRAYAERQWRDAMAACRVVNAEFRLRAPDGGWRWTNVRAAPVLDEAGKIEKWAGINIDIDARKRAEAALRESEERYQALFAASPAPFLILDPDAPRFTIIEVNSSYLAATMRTRDEVIGRGVFEAFPDNPATKGDASVRTLRASFEKVLATRQPDTLPGLKYDIARPDGTFEQRWWSPVNSPVLNEDGTVVAIIHNANDVTEAQHAAAALRESEARYRNLFETMRQGYLENELIRDARGRAVDYLTKAVNPQFERLTGIPGGHAVGRTARELVGDLDPAWLETYDRVVRTGQPERFEREEPAFGRWFEVQAYPLVGDRFAILYDDITERRRTDAALRQNEQRLRVLVGELQHRVRNILAVIRSVYAQTVDAGGTPEEEAAHFAGRLDALARTQVIVTRSARGLVDLEDLIREELLTVGTGLKSEITIAGPDVTLSAKAAETLGLAIHELTTNSVKYGALKFPATALHIQWNINSDHINERRLVLIWQEHGVPAVSMQPAKRGFGSELIMDALPYRLGAQTELQFRGGGVRCMISMPLSDEASSADPFRET